MVLSGGDKYVWNLKFTDFYEFETVTKGERLFFKWDKKKKKKKSKQSSSQQFLFFILFMQLICSEEATGVSCYLQATAVCL